MKEKSLIVLFFFAWIFITNIHAQIDYPAQSSEFYQPAMSSDMPMQQSSFQSSSYYNNTYTVPFAAENINVINKVSNRLGILRQEVIKLGFLIGVGGVVTYRNAKNIVNVIKNIDF